MTKNRRIFVRIGQFCRVVAAILIFAVTIVAQAPDASLAGLVTNSDGQPLSAVNIVATHSATGLTQKTISNGEGRYFFASLPRGTYNLVAELAGYQFLEKQGIQLEVGARHEENIVVSSRPKLDNPTVNPEIFRLIPPPPSLTVDTTASSLSVVIDESKLLQLPLATRNVYSLFLLQPGVTSQGAIGVRGLSFSVHGQRVSGSNYQLDGVDNNNIVLTGPVVGSSAEAVQEFRMVNSSFSAENGRATAFVAQVITRSGSNHPHGTVFEFLANDRLNANTDENKAKSVAKSPLRQNQFGYELGGPLRTNRTFFSSGLELSRLRYGSPQKVSVPSQIFIDSLPPDSVARLLLAQTPPYPSIPTAGDPKIGELNFQAPNRIDNIGLNQRIDHNFSNHQDRLTFRYVGAFSTQALSETYGGIGIAYPNLIPKDKFTAQNAMVRWTHSFSGSRSNDARLGWSGERIEMLLPKPDLPMVQSLDTVLLPGSTRQYGQAENNNVLELSDTFSAQKGRSNITAGFDWRSNFSNSLSLGLQNETLGGSVRIPNGLYVFNSLADFGRGQPIGFSIGIDHFSSKNIQLPDLSRKSRSIELAGFIENDAKLTRRLSLNLGLRYEYYGVLHSTDPSKDVNFYFGRGSTIEERLSNGVLRTTDQNPGDLKARLYRPDRLNLGPSMGIAWDPFGRGRSVVRAGYAVAFDRILDTVRDLRSNSLQTQSCVIFVGCMPSFLTPIDKALANLSNRPILPALFSVVQLDERLRTPYVQNWYLGMQHSVTPNLTLEIGHAGSIGRKLLSRDIINRLGPDFSSPNKSIGDDTYISNQAASSYVAMEMALRRRFSRGLQYQFSYTWSHVIDNQSDIFQGVRTDPRTGAFALATFTRQFDSRLDRGNADFDQRHNLVANVIWEIPAPRIHSVWTNHLLRYWTLSLIGAHRSGFPVTVIGNSFLSDPTTGLLNNRLDFAGNSPEPYISPHPAAIPGGVQWLDPSRFRPAVGHPGNIGRGAIPGPGFWNYDLALLHDFSVSESKQIQFRLEFYNVFNHANLSAPVTTYLSNPFTGEFNPDFGKAFYGLNRTHSRFGDLPLENSARTVQLGLRFRF